MNTKMQGSVGVTYATYVYSSKGYSVSLPTCDKQRYDLVVDKGGELFRVEVKTSQCKAPSGNYRFSVATKGGNRSGTKITTLSSKECDLVFLYGDNGDAWEFPISVVEGMKTIIPSKDSEYYIRAH